jgi:hyperosmotically inducible protein
MKKSLGLSCLVAGMLLGSGMAIAAESTTDSDRSHPGAFVKDSVITMKIKSKLAAEHMGTMAHIRVDTDKDGVVWLNGTARTQDDADRAVSIARATENVRSVHSDITVKLDD